MHFSQFLCQFGVSFKEECTLRQGVFQEVCLFKSGNATTLCYLINGILMISMQSSRIVQNSEDRKWRRLVDTGKPLIEAKSLFNAVYHYLWFQLRSIKAEYKFSGAHLGIWWPACKSKSERWHFYGAKQVMYLTDRDLEVQRCRAIFVTGHTFLDNQSGIARI